MLKLSDDIPAVRPKQLGIFDALVDRDELAREVSSGIVMSERAILRQDESADEPWTKAIVGDGSDSSGHRRKAFGNELEEVLETVFQQAKVMFGWDTAVLVLFRILARDPSYLKTAPEWILWLIVEEKELLTNMFGGLMRGALQRDETDEDEEDEDDVYYEAEYDEALVAAYYERRSAK